MTMTQFTFQELQTIAYALHRLTLIEAENLTDALQANDPPELVKLMLDRSKQAEALRDRFDSIVDEARSALPV